MMAVDTNVIVRLVVADDPHQWTLAKQCVAEGVFVPHGVFMEAEWVLRTSYRLPTAWVADALMDLVNLDCVQCDDPDLLRWAIGRYREGADLADMLHLVAARGHAGLATFDRALPRQAGDDAPTPIEVLK